MSLLLKSYPYLRLSFIYFYVGMRYKDIVHIGDSSFLYFFRRIFVELLRIVDICVAVLPVISLR